MSIKIRRLGDLVIALDNSIQLLEGDEFLRGLSFLFLKEGKNLRLMFQELDKFILFQDQGPFVVTRELSCDNENINLVRDNTIVVVNMVNERLTFTIDLLEKLVKIERSLT